MNRPFNPARSNIMIPAHREKFVAKAHLRNADIITLDLEDGVAPEEKELARSAVKDSIARAARGGAAIYVRINNEEEQIEQDLEACVCSRLDGICIPKVETADQLRRIENAIDKYEAAQGMPIGTIRTDILIESARGYLNAREIAAATKRGEFLDIGSEDFSKELEVELNGGTELAPYYTEIIVCARAYGMRPTGLLSSLADYKDLKGLRSVALASAAIGIVGAACIHPDQVKCLNEAFAPDKDLVEQSKTIVRLFDEARKNGQGVTSLDGKMIDRPVAERARRILHVQSKIDAFEEYKKSCVEAALNAEPV